jgi:glycosyltransferase involved in cell wall biosynthesis
MKVLRIYHVGRDPAHRERDRALVRAGVKLTLVVPASWPGAPSDDDVADEPFPVVRLRVHRPGDVNRHRFAEPRALAALVADRQPDVVDLHEEPFSSVVRQVLHHLPAGQPVVGYTAQNIDKRFPPPFSGWERRALARMQGLYPCSRQAASVVVGKGFTGAVRVLPLAPPRAITAGDQQPPTDVLHMLLVGRMLPEKGVLDAVRTLAEVRRHVPATLTLVGEGPQTEAAGQLAAELGVADALTMSPWLDAPGLAEQYRRAHVVLAPSRATRTWVEQFGRMVVEAQTAGAVVVGYASGALPEVVGEAGVLVEEGNIAALGRAVLCLHWNPEQWKALRTKGLQHAPTWDAVAAGQIELYEQAATATTIRHRVRAQRTHAQATFGPPAGISGGGRPFALPYLRADTGPTRVLGAVADRLSRPETQPVPPRLRIVYLDHVAKLSGGELALSRLLAALPDVDAHVILAEDGPLRGRLEQAGCTVEVLALDPRAGELRRGEVGTGLATVRAAALTLVYTLCLARRLRALHPDLVHTNSLKSGFYGGAAAKLARVPVVWHLRAAWPRTTCRPGRSR